jgi:hypothetical protein
MKFGYACTFERRGETLVQAAGSHEPSYSVSGLPAKFHLKGL